MINIDPTKIEAIKQSANLLAEVEKRGIVLEKKGNEYKGLCPFHTEKSPSFHVNPTKNTWKCFGCGAGGDIFKFIMDYDQVGFPEAYQSLEGELEKSKAPLEKRETSSLIQAENHQRESEGRPADPLINDVLNYYTQTLKNTPTALGYLKKRGLTHPDLINHFRIGYCDRILNKLIPNNDKKRREILKSCGILSEEGRESMNGRLIFPVFTETGKLGEIYGHRVGRNRPEFPNHKYLPQAHQGVFNAQSIGHSSPLILCESIIDALSFWVHGFKHVTASFGTNGFTDEMLEHFKSKQIQSIWIAYDNDDSGNQAADSLAPKLLKHGIRVERILLPKEQDVNQLICESDDPQKDLQSLLNQRQSYAPLTNQENKHPLNGWDGKQLNLNFGSGVPPNRQYRIRGIERIKNIGSLKVQIKVGVQELYFLDTLDLTVYKQRLSFINGASEELGLTLEVIKRDLGKTLLEVENLVEQLLNQAEEKEEENKPKILTSEEMEEALTFLKSENLFELILKDFESVGLVGEESNKLVGYLVAISRKLDEPLATLIQSSSSAGKTTLMNAILALMPPEDYEKWTMMTSQSLYYVEDEMLKNKILAVAEEEGMEKATYPLKILQSEKELKIATTVKDPKTGEFKVQSKIVEGPCAIILTTTSVEIDEELVNRFIRLTVNEDKEHTEAILKAQRQADALEGFKRKALKEEIKRKHHNAQRMLKSIQVINPYSEQLTFMSDYLRNRRDHKKYLGLIKTITLLYQYQCPVKQTEIHGQMTDYIEVDIEDIKKANHLMADVLGRCLDELAPQTRRLLQLIYKMIKGISDKKDLEINEIRFTRRQVREYTRWSDSQLKLHMKRLEEMEYLVAHQGGRSLTFIYELLWFGEGEDGSNFLPGLVDPKKLKN